MENKFYSLKVKDIHRTTPACSIISFDVPEQLANTFQFIQGQYLTLKAQINGEEVRRSYSICSSPMDGELKVGIKRIEDGKFSTYATQVLKVGDEVEVMPPNGNFYKEIEPASSKNYLAIAAGSGITPIFSIIKTHLLKEPNCTFTLLYVNQNANSVILKDELEGLKNTYLERVKIFHFLTKQSREIPLFNGRITEEKLDVIFDKLVNLESVDDIFLCGPEQMIFLVKDYVAEKGMDKGRVHFELFSSGNSADIEKRKASYKQDGKVCDVTIREGGKTFDFKLPFGGNNLLDAAIANSADLPFACKGGVCCTCKAKLTEGKVDMLVNYALEQEEVDEGYILTCQAMPVSERVVVDFDF